MLDKSMTPNKLWRMRKRTKKIISLFMKILGNQRAKKKNCRGGNTFIKDGSEENACLRNSTVKLLLTTPVMPDD